MTTYVALLRGINVGGNNKVSMAELATAFRDAGYEDVRTVLASGNVLFTAKGASARKLETAIEATLKKAFGTAFPTVVLSRDELAKVIDAAPKGHDSATLRADVFFLKHPLTAKQALAKVPELREGVDSIAAGPGVLYFSRVKAKATKTRIQTFMAKPVYQELTVRTWGTVTKLLTLLDQ